MNDYKESNVVGLIAPKDSALDLAADMLKFVRQKCSEGLGVRLILSVAVRGEHSDQHYRWIAGGSGIERIGDAAWTLAMVTREAEGREQ